MHKPTYPIQPKKKETPPSRLKKTTRAIGYEDDKIILLEIDNIYSDDIDIDFDSFKKISFSKICEIQKIIKIEDFDIYQVFDDEYFSYTAIEYFIEKSNNEYEKELADHENRFVIFEEQLASYKKQMQEYKDWQKNDKIKKLNNQLKQLNATSNI